MSVSAIIFSNSVASQETIENIQKVAESFIILSGKKLQETSSKKAQAEETKKMLSECNEFALGTDNDIFIVSDDGFECSILHELIDVMSISERHAAISPRGINMGILSMPEFSPNKPVDHVAEYKKAHQLVSVHMPRYHIIPYPSTICVLLRGSLIKQFGFLDTSCDSFEKAVITWCMERGQTGYSSIAANKVFMCNTNSHRSDYLFDKRFEYIQKLTNNYNMYGLSIYDRFAGVISDTYYDKPKILLSMYLLAPVYNGTTEHAFSLAKRLIKYYSDKYEFHLLITHENAVFFKVHNDFPIIIYPEQIKETYHLGITFTQIYQTELLVLLNAHCLKIIQTVLDLISYRCIKLAANTNMLAFRKSVQYSDGIITISTTVKNDLVAAFPTLADDIMRKAKSIFISNADKNEMMTRPEIKIKFDDFILVFGNKFEHKLIHLILPYLTRIKRNFILVGYSKNIKQQNVQAFPSGALSYEFVDSLYKNCTALLFPSTYEGYGLPIVNALEKGKTVIVNNTEINRELQASFPQYKNKFLFFNTFNEIITLLESTEFTTDSSPAPVGRTYDDVAAETEVFISEILAKQVNFDKLLARNELAAMIGNCSIKDVIKRKLPLIFKILKRIKKAFIR